MTMLAGGTTGFEVHTAGETETSPIPGGLVCVECGYALRLLAEDTLPHCPTCGGKSFRRTAMFEQTTVDADAVHVAEDEPEAVAEARRDLTGTGPHLVWESEDGVRTFSLSPGWSRVGRSASADVRLDDPTVSRRHALIVLTDEGELKALDDRSLNGLFINGERTEWAPLTDGDELEIGRYRLYVVT